MGGEDCTAHEMGNKRNALDADNTSQDKSAVDEPVAANYDSASAEPVVEVGELCRNTLEAQLALLSNRNCPSHYIWLRELLGDISTGNSGLVKDFSSGASGSPLFVVAGACPSRFAPMQAVVYCCMNESAEFGSGITRIDFWWLKPRNGLPNTLEAETLNRHASGPHKNDPGRSKDIYRPLAELFSSSGKQGAHLLFGIEGARAYIMDSDTNECYYICLVWQEDWTSNPLARSRFVKGMIIYQKNPIESAFFTRPFAIIDKKILIPSGTAFETACAGALPSDELKLAFQHFAQSGVLSPISSARSSSSLSSLRSSSSRTA